MSDPNENRAGYKETKIGWIPEEWGCRKIGEKCTLINGRGFKPHEWGNSGLPIIRIQNLKGAKEFNYYSGEFNPKILVETGQFLFAWSGSKGASFGPHIWSGPTGLLNYHTWKVVLNPEVEKRFFLEILQHITSSIESDAHGAAALVHVQKTWMENYLIPYPPLSEQKEIANILSTCNEAIKKTSDLISAKKRQKEALMQQLLTGKKRLPGFEGEWMNLVLDKFCTRLRNVADDPTSYPVLSITAKSGFVSQQDKFSRVIAGKQVEKYVLLKRGDFAYNKGNSYSYPQGCVYPLSEYEAGLVPNVFYSFKLEEDRASPEFIKQYFLAGLHNKHLYRWINSGVRNNGLLNLNASDFFKLPIKLPPLLEQSAIGTVLCDADTEIKKLHKKFAALQKQKKALMQKLLTGQVRVKV